MFPVAMKKSIVYSLTLAALASATALQAQGTGQRRDRNKDIPPSERPPAGMCRIWLDSVPAAQQPAPTDCATAVRNRPPKGRVIFGDDYVTQKRGDSTKGKPNPAIQGFAPSDKKRPPIRFP
ncbi:MAG TPA: hypothetical protein VFT29_09625 [Gemmatimonadaceae bacterium]|nr:hypothetical protein [Gemmatimonadaceae bacterium]